MLHDESIKYTDTSDFYDLKMMWTRYNDTTTYDEKMEVVKMLDITIHEEDEDALNDFINEMYYSHKKALRYEERETKNNVSNR
jgi:hypothetical protein